MGVQPAVEPKHGGGGRQGQDFGGIMSKGSM